MRAGLSRLDVYRLFLAEPYDHADQERIGHRVIDAKPDGREKVVTPLRAVTTKREVA